jgi:hypothetical protein
MAEFEELIWNRPEFNNEGNELKWNVENIPEFIKWHMQSASHHKAVKERFVSMLSIENKLR